MSQRRNKFAVITIIIAALLYAANVLIDNPYTHSLVNYYLNERFLSKLPITAEYQSMRLQLFPPAVRLFGVSVKSKVNSNDVNESAQELISTSQISLVVSPWSLFLAKPQIGDLEINDLRAYWPPPAELLTALKTLEPKDHMKQQDGPAQWPPKPAAPLSSLTLRNATLRATLNGLSVNSDQDPAEETTISTEGADISIDFNGWRDISVKADLKKVAVWDRGRSYVEDASLVLSGGLRGNTFRTSAMQINSTRINSEGDLSVAIQNKTNSRDIDRIALEINQSSQVDFSVLGSFLDLGGTSGMITGKTKTKLTIPLSETETPKLLVEGTAKSRGAVLSGFHFYDSEADISIDMDALTFKELRVRSGEKTFGKAKGKLSFNQSLDYAFQGKPESLPFDMLLGVFNVPFDIVNFNLTSQNLELYGKGDPFSMKVTADGDLKDFSTPTLVYDHKRYPISPACNIRFDLQIDSNKLSYGDTKGSCKSAGAPAAVFPLQISGVTTFNDREGMDLNLTSISNFDPAGVSYFSQTNMSGQGSMNTRIHGPYSHILVDTSLSLKDTQIEGIPLGNVSAETRVDGDKLTWQNILISPKQGGVILSKAGQINFNEAIDLQAELHAEKINRDITTAGIRLITGDQQGSLGFHVNQFDGTLSGPLLQPFRYRGTLSGDVSNVSDNQNEFATSLKTRIKLEERDISTDQTQIVLGSLNVGVKAKINKDHDVDQKFLGGLGLSKKDRVTLEVTASPIQATSSDQVGAEVNNDHLKHIPYLHPLAAEYGLAGTVSGSAKLEGNFERLSGLAKVNLNQVRILSISAPSISSSVIFDGLKLDIIAEQGGTALKGRMNLDAGEPGMPYKWYLSCRNFDARPVLPAFFSADPRSFAYFTGTWSMEGRFDQWWSSTGNLDLRSARAKYYPPRDAGTTPFEVQTTKQVQVDMSKNGWAFRQNERLVLNSDYGSLEVGLENTHPPQKIGIPVRGSLNLESLKNLSTSLEAASGQIQISGGIYGSIEEPIFDLTVSDTKITAETASTWQPITLGHADYRPALKDVQFNARIRGGGIQLESFNSTKGSGTIKGSGFFAFKQTATDVTDLNIFLDNASFLYPFPIVKNFDSVIDGNISIKGQGLENPLLAAGNIKIRRARSNRDIDIRDAILTSIRSSGSRAGPQTLKPTINFDLSVNADETISFTSRVAQVALSTNLKISGSDIAPEILGLIEVKKGKFFYKRDFIVRRGLINFDDPIKPDPSLDISALSEVGSYKVTILIGGRASEPVIDFTVDPTTRPDGTAISKLDIITLLSRGSLPEQKPGTANSAESTAAAEALNLLAGQVEDTVQKVFDLSGQNIIRQVYIDTYAPPEGGAPIARFNFPLNITDDLDLILQVDQSTVKLSSEYSLHDSISLTGGIESTNDETGTSAKKQGTPADTGVDIKFRFAFP